MKNILPDMIVALRCKLLAAEKIDDLTRTLTDLGFDPKVEHDGGCMVLRVCLDTGPDDDAAPDPKMVPKPAPPPEPAPEFRKIRSARKVAPAAVVPGPLEGEERELAFNLLATGLGPPEVARRLDRKTKQIANLKQRNKAEIAARMATAAASDPKPPAPAADPPAEMSFSDRVIAAHLNALGYVAPWNAKADYELAKCLVRGDGAPGAATQLGVTKDAVCARWAALNTDRGSIDHQTRLIRILATRAGVAG